MKRHVYSVHSAQFQIQTEQPILKMLPGRLFPREPVNFVNRKWTVSQEISQNISKVSTNLTYLYHFVDEKSLEFQQIRTFEVFSVV